MLKRWIIYSILTFLLGLNLRLSFGRRVTDILFWVMAIISILFFIFGMLKKLRYSYKGQNF